jgi:hypothetical protein
MMANRKADPEKSAAGREQMMQQLRVYQAKMDAWLADTKVVRKEMMACKMPEARLEDKEPTSVSRKPEVPKRKRPT